MTAQQIRDIVGSAPKFHADDPTTNGTIDPIGQPDITVLNEGRRAPPVLPCDDQGPFLSWARWIRETADSKSAPRDYVACSLLAAVAGMIGNAR
jgi:hypothetical protein